MRQKSESRKNLKYGLIDCSEKVLLSLSLGYRGSPVHCYGRFYLIGRFNRVLNICNSTLFSGLVFAITIPRTAGLLAPEYAWHRYIRNPPGLRSYSLLIFGNDQIMDLVLQGSIFQPFDKIGVLVLDNDNCTRDPVVCGIDDAFTRAKKEVGIAAN